MAMNNGMRRLGQQERMQMSSQCPQERMQKSSQCPQERMQMPSQCPHEHMQIQVPSCIQESMIDEMGPGDKKAIARCVYESGFALIETMLYLDTHPDDREALAYFANMKIQYKQCVRKYNEICGPLRFTDVDSEEYWTWVMTPMPWEMEG